MITTPGKTLVKEALPPEYRAYADKPLDGKTMGALMTEIARRDPRKYVDVVQRLNDIGRRVAYEYGRDASLSIKDLINPAMVANKQRDLRERARMIVNDPRLSSDDKLDALVTMTAKHSKDLDERIHKELLGRNNSMARQIQAGSRGNKTQLTQIALGDMLMTNAENKLLPHPGLEGYAQGLSPFTYWLGSESARKGAVDTQFATADSGYFSKQVSNVAHRLLVTQDDCGTENGLEVDGDDADNVGAVLLKDAGPLKAGTIIKSEHLPLLAGRRVTVRSPLGCKAKEGVCRKCAGAREKGTLPDIGDAVGINAVRSFSEGVTQAAVGSKHGGKAETKGSGDLEGFKEINQFVQVPKEFVGGAVLAKADGKVAKIEEAPQGGKYVTISGERYHIPKERAATVRIGDDVEAGDAISDGTPNPAEIASYKGIGAGRKYFLDKFGEILKKNKAGTNRRNLELFARAFVSKVRVTDPEGLQGHLVGDVVDYDDIAHSWEPRKGSGLKSVTSAGNLYLEKPYLHYSIGTRVTPKVSKDLRKGGVSTVVVHSEPAPFEPLVVRAQDFMKHDKDWITRLAGENLKRSLSEAAARGSTSEKGGTSYYPELATMGMD